MFALLWEAAVRATLVAGGAGLVLWAARVTVAVLPAESWQGGELTRTAARTVSTAAEAADDGTIGASGVDWGRAAAVVYFAGAGLMLLRLLIGIWKVRILLQGAARDRTFVTHEGCPSPMTVGWIRPAVILPTGWKRWPQEQLRAVLAHEGEHVRRRDPLMQTLALANRAVFWFHPLAWWLEREISRLAEQACDAAVLARGHQPRSYAECLVALARAASRGRGGLLGMAAPGAGLRERIKAILAGAVIPPVSRQRAAFAMSACAAAAAICLTGSLGHAQLDSPAFEVASIKPNRSMEHGGTSKFEGATYTGKNVTLKRVIRLAYSPVQEYAGGPSWIDSEHFDITAKAAGNPSREQLLLMLRSLLADRFRLAVHKETREMAAYALVLDRRDGKLGPSMKRSEVNCAPTAPDKPPAGTCGFRMGHGTLIGRGATMERLASELILTGRLVVDRTGLTGGFDMDLQWTPDELEASATLFTALREQLGLKLEAIKAPVEVIVIDRAEKPSEN